MTILSKHIVLLSFLLLAACGGQSTVKPTPTRVEPKPTTSSTSTPPKKTAEQSTPQNIPSTVSGNEASSMPISPTVTTKPSAGGYYLDDGPSENAPTNIDGIPGASPKTELLNKRANSPYRVLGKQYLPMTQYSPYKEQGIASWYGKKFHGRKTSTGEIYDMYGMSAAHTTLPIPSYVKVTNPANGRSVIVRVNDRGPFKSSRLLDLSYAAAYQLRLIKQGSGLVEIELINTNPEALRKVPVPIALASTEAFNNHPSPKMEIKPEEPAATANPVIQKPLTTSEAKISPTQTEKSNMTLAPEVAGAKAPPTLTTHQEPSSIVEYYVQAGAFKNETNGDQLTKRIQALALAEYVGIANVYNNDLYRVKLGPYDSKQAAEADATSIRVKLNIPTFVTNQ